MFSFHATAKVVGTVFAVSLFSWQSLQFSEIYAVHSASWFNTQYKF